MKTKHTSGPWNVGRKTANETWCVWAGKLRIAWIDFWGEQIESGNFKSESEQQANARLIAAAPELLAALEKIVRLKDCIVLSGATDADKTMFWSDVNDAIAKATGA